MSGGVLYRCKNCFDQGRTRTFKTTSGYRAHLEIFHDAKKSDLVRVVASPKQEPSNGDQR